MTLPTYTSNMIAMNTLWKLSTDKEEAYLMLSERYVKEDDLRAKLRLVHAEIVKEIDDTVDEITDKQKLGKLLDKLFLPLTED